MNIHADIYIDCARTE